MVIILVIGAYLIKSYNNLDLKNPEGAKTFIKLYSGWVFNLGNNIKEITGYVAKKEWLPENNQSNRSTN